MAPEIQIELVRGKTFDKAFLYAESTLVYKQIDAIPSLAPVRLSVPAHSVPDGWPVEVRKVVAPVELNTTEEVPHHWVTRIDDSTLELNSLELLGTKPYSGASKGVIAYRKPMDLAGWSARAQFRDKLGGSAVYLTLNSDPLLSPDGEISVDTTRHQFVITISASTTASFLPSKGVWELEAVSPTGEVYGVVGVSPFTVTGEVVL